MVALSFPFNSLLFCSTRNNGRVNCTAITEISYIFRKKLLTKPIIIEKPSACGKARERRHPVKKKLCNCSLRMVCFIVGFFLNLIFSFNVHSLDCKRV